MRRKREHMRQRAGGAADGGAFLSGRHYTLTYVRLRRGASEQLQQSGSYEN